MVAKQMKSKKKSVVKAVAKSKNSKTSKSKVALARVNINIPKSLHIKTKQFSLKNKITIQSIVSTAIKEYLNKPAVLDTKSDI